MHKFLAHLRTVKIVLMGAFAIYQRHLSTFCFNIYTFEGKVLFHTVQLCELFSECLSQQNLEPYSKLGHVGSKTRSNLRNILCML